MVNMNRNANKKPAQTIILKDMTIPYNTEKWTPRNFRGLERIKDGQIVNQEGVRNFCIFLPPIVNRIIKGQNGSPDIDENVTCEQLIEDGWNISKSINQVDPQADPSYMLRVKVRYHEAGSDLERLNPKVRLVVDNDTMMEMDEDNIGDLDNAQIVKANLTIHGTWNSKPSYTGYVAYLSKLVARVYAEEGSMDDLMEGIMD